MSSDDFQFAVAIAGAAIGLVALLLLAVVTVGSSWRLFRSAEQASLSASRASLAVEELSRRLMRSRDSEAQPAQSGLGFEDLRAQAMLLVDQQSKLQETLRALVESGAFEGAASADSLQNVERSVQRLDNTVGQMTAAVVNLLQQSQSRTDAS